MNQKIKNRNTGKKDNAFLQEDDSGLPLFSVNNTYFNEEDRDVAETTVPELPGMTVPECLQSSSGGEGNGIAAFREEILLPELREVEQTKRDGALSGMADWGEELLVLLPELQELTDRGNFVTGRASGEFPELHEILGKLSETSEKLERISSVIEKFEQEYRT